MARIKAKSALLADRNPLLGGASNVLASAGFDIEVDPPLLHVSKVVDESTGRRSHVHLPLTQVVSITPAATTTGQPSGRPVARLHLAMLVQHPVTNAQTRVLASTKDVQLTLEADGWIRCITSAKEVLFNAFSSVLVALEFDDAEAAKPHTS